MNVDWIIQERIWSSDVSCTAKAVMQALVYHADKETGIAFPGQATLAKEIGRKSRGTAGDALKALEAKALIKCVGAHGRSKHFQLCWEDGSPITAASAHERAAKRAADAGKGVSRCRTDRQLMTEMPSADDGGTVTNRRNEQKNKHQSPTQAVAAPPGEEVEVVIPKEEATRMFEEFWKAYPDRCPYKTNREECCQKYVKLLAKSEDPTAFHAWLLGSLKRWDESKMWNTKEGERFIKSPKNWLDKCSWKESPAPDKALKAKKAAENRIYNWGLCAENCANCTGSGCKEGIKIPPNWQKGNEHRPEDCEHFKALAAKDDQGG